MSLLKILFGEKLPPIRVNYAAHEELPKAGLTMGNLYIGAQGRGKTSSLARHLVEQFDNNPDEAIFVLDWSGDLSNKILTQFCQRDYAKRQQDMHRIVYDELGHPEWVLPLPELTEAYGGTFEDEIDRVKNNLNGLYKNPSAEAVIMAGVAINKTLPEIYRLLTHIKNPYGETWQVTEAELLIESPKVLNKALKDFEASLPPSTFFYLRDQIASLKADERNKRTYILMELFGWIRSNYLRAKLGYSRPAWTPKEAIKRGQMVIVNGARMINNPTARDYVFTQIWSLVKAELNRRMPADAKDKPVSVVLDETRNLFDVPAFAKEIGDVSPVYRSRKVQLYIVIQGLAQLDRELYKKIWMLGNIVCFGMENKDDCLAMAFQLNHFRPTQAKLPDQQEKSVAESANEQDREGADWIYELDDRQCLVKRYLNEQHRDKAVQYVRKTKDLPTRPIQIPLDELKEQLLKERGMRIMDALDVVDRRRPPDDHKPPPQGTTPDFLK